jgi:hypothetical protein
LRRRQRFTTGSLPPPIDTISPCPFGKPHLSIESFG